jgi:hypothetical protein
MLVSTCHGWPVQPETQASTPERSGKVASSRVGDAHSLQLNLTVLCDLDARAIPWSKQILKVFICGLAQHNGVIPKVL